MSSLYARYIKEREGFECLEYDHGFITFRIDGNVCYIRDAFIEDGYRKSGLMRVMGQKVIDIAKDRSCDYLLTSVCPTAKGCNEMVNALIHYGFKLTKSVDNLIYWVKEI